MAQLDRPTGAGHALRWFPSPIHAVLRLLGGVLGIGVAILIYRQYASVPLALFALGAVPGVIGYMLPHVITRPRRVARASFFLTALAASLALLYGIYAVSGNMWAAVLITVVAGSAISSTIGQLLFPAVYEEEAAEFRPWARPEEWDAPGPRDLVPRRSKEEHTER